MVLPFCILGTILSFPWNIVSASIAAVVLGFAFAEYRRRRKQDALEHERKEKLKDPFEIHFLIPKAVEHKVDYHPQDGEYHYPDELTLRPNSEADVLVWLKPRLNVTLSELQFGCIGDDNESKPEPLYFVHPFVKEGIRKEIHPNRDADHYLDWQNYYHILYHGRAFPEGETHFPGLRIRTKKKGAYDFWVGIIMPEGRADKHLKINVV